MKYVKTFEYFITDDNRGEDDKYPELNPVLKKQVTEYVEDKLNSNQFHEIFHLLGLNPPKELTGEDFDKNFDDVKEKAIQYLLKNPEQLGKEVKFKQMPVNSGDGVARTNNIGGALRESVDPKILSDFGYTQEEYNKAIDLIGEESTGRVKRELGDDISSKWPPHNPGYELMRKIDRFYKELTKNENDQNKKIEDTQDYFLELTDKGYDITFKKSTGIPHPDTIIVTFKFDCKNSIDTMISNISEFNNILKRFKVKYHLMKNALTQNLRGDIVELSIMI